jgi:hypothetical protein
VKKFESYVKKRYAGAESKKFKFKFENTGCKRGYRVTWCPDVVFLDTEENVPFDERETWAMGWSGTKCR